MSLKRVLLLGALSVLLLPAAANADTVRFGWSGGAFDFTGSSGAGLALTNDTSWGGTAAGTAAATLTFIQRTNPLPITTLSSVLGLGSVLITTGQFTGFSGSVYQFGSGGNVTFTSSALLASMTGGAIAANTVIFSGAFTGVTTFTPVGCPSSITNANCFRLFGNIVGNLSSSFSNYFGIGGPQGAGFILQSDVQLLNNLALATMLSGDAQITVPEPGTLALFGTGLIGLAGLLRKKLAA
ncbi:MAG: PEP-CTERM sorting domain-containing protein [Acidobacteria bacterium]|nr:PEP-CTERM sorting domain-containing protein [Acidobacteriota bacterium]